MLATSHGLVMVCAMMVHLVIILIVPTFPGMKKNTNTHTYVIYAYKNAKLFSDGGDCDCSDIYDIDGDGVTNDVDAFPTDPSETADLDGDGVGNNADATE